MNIAKKCIVFAVFVMASAYAKDVRDLVRYVDPRIGVMDSNVSNCVIGPQLPFGSVNPSPNTPRGLNDGYDPTQPIRGFSQLHASGTGWGKYGQFLVSPQIGLAVGETEHDSPKSNESTQAYQYAVMLTKYNIRTEFVPAHHSVIYRFTFPESDQSHILIDVTHNIPMDIATYIGGKVHAGEVTVDKMDPLTITGHGRYEGGFGEGQYDVYFCAKFNKATSEFGTWKNGKINAGSRSDILSEKNDRLGGYARFTTQSGEAVLMKIGISFKSVAQAEVWLDSEISGWDYENVRDAAKEKWNEALSGILVDDGSERDKTIFYTALYHAMLMPRDRTGDFSKFDPTAPLWDDQYAAWDTWRSEFPLMALIRPTMVRDVVHSFIERFRVNGMVRDAFVAGIDMYAEQGGNNIDNIIADAYVKGIDGVNWEQAYSVVKNDAESERNGWQGFDKPAVLDTVMGSYRKNGWIPAGIMSCSYTLEYAYNDFCASEMAKELGKTEDAKKYLERSHQWTALWDKSTISDGYSGFIRPKHADGKWIAFNPKKTYASWVEYFYEGSSWTYSYLMPHDIPRLIEITGGAEAYVKRLQHALNKNLIDYSNEPAFLTLRTFHYALRPDLTSYWTRKVMDENYSDRGYPGNEDSGAMGSWYVFSAAGLFPNAGQDFYFINGPSFEKVTIQLGNGNRFVIEGMNTSKFNKYVRSCTLNGKTWNQSWIRHKDVAAGGVLRCEMGDTPSDWGKTVPPPAGK